MVKIYIRKLDCGHWTVVITKKHSNKEILAALEIAHDKEFSDVLLLLNNKEFCEDIKLLTNV